MLIIGGFQICGAGEEIGLAMATKTKKNDYIKRSEAWKCDMSGDCCRDMQLTELSLAQWDYYHKKYPFLKLQKRIKTGDDEFSFEFKCGALDGDVCTVYAKRPQFCRAYPFDDVKRSELHEDCGFRKTCKAAC